MFPSKLRRPLATVIPAILLTGCVAATPKPEDTVTMNGDRISPHTCGNGVCGTIISPDKATQVYAICQPGESSMTVQDEEGTIFVARRPGLAKMDLTDSAKGTRGGILLEKDAATSSTFVHTDGDIRLSPDALASGLAAMNDVCGRLTAAYEVLNPTKRNTGGFIIKQNGPTP